MPDPTRPGSNLRYGKGGLAGKRALAVVTIGSGEASFGHRGINGQLDQLLFRALSPRRDIPAEVRRPATRRRSIGRMPYLGGVSAGWNESPTAMPESESSTLEPVRDGGKPIRLDAKGLQFFAFDTDGSVLAATYGNPARVYDCVLPSGKCTRLEDLPTKNGDPIFIGSDM